MTTLNMHPVIGPGGKDAQGRRSLLSLFNQGEVIGGIERYYYGSMLNHHDRYGGGFDDANSSQRILMGDRPIFKIFINPKSHCKAHS